MNETPRTTRLRLPIGEAVPVRVPRNSYENRILKEGLIDLNNERISYFRVPLLLPSLIVTAVSLTAFFVAVLWSLRADIVPSNEQMRKGVLLPYGTSAIFCNSSVPLPIDGLPSILMLLERNVMGNILFRVAAVIPIIVRVFQSNCIRHMARTSQQEGLVFEVTSDLLPALTAAEAISMALFAIVTAHSDSSTFNRFAKLTFALTAALNMLATTIIVFNYKSRSLKRLDAISLSIKMVCTFFFCYLSPQYFQKHHLDNQLQTCHSHVPRLFAFMEYVVILSYGIYHLSWLIDIRHVYFFCYPRECSGECEPLDPANFKEGGRYEHCRAFELRQKQLSAYGQFLYMQNLY